MLVKSDKFISVCRDYNLRLLRKFANALIMPYGQKNVLQVRKTQKRSNWMKNPE